MNSRHFLIRFIVLACLTTSMLAMTNAKTENVFPMSSFEPLVIAGLDDDASFWGIYPEGNPVGEKNNVSDPSLDGTSFRCAITGGDPNSNIHCYRNLDAEPASNFFSMSLSFYYRPPSSFNNVGEPSIVQALEFSMSKWDQGLRYEWALQWENVDAGGVDTGAPEWLYWDPFPIPGRWAGLGISGPVSGEQWHELILDGEIRNGKAHYSRFVFDGHEYQLNIPDAAPIADSANDKLAVAIQLDGNSTETPYEVFIDNVTLATSDSVGAVVNSITRAGTNPTGETNVDFTVTFSEPVTGVDISDFSLTATGVSGPTVSGISGSGNMYTVTVNTGSGSGTIRLDTIDDDTILDPDSNPLGGAGTGNGDFIGGETYTIAKSWIFGDVPDSYWANSWIETLYNAGITGGCSLSPLLYCPLNPVTRAQMAIFILRGIHGSTYTPPPATGTVFSDVPIDAFGAAWIEQFANEGITSGCGPGMYCPETNVTRTQMAIFLLKGKHGSSYIPPVATGDFLDVPVGSFAADWIEQLAAEGITSGCGGGNYCPDADVTRDQMAVFLVRTFNLPKSR